MQEQQKLGFSGSMMQAFTSVGPMLDIVAVFSVIAIYSGIMLPIVMALSFIVGFTTINTVYRFSRIFVSNGGYYTYIGKSIGKLPAIFIGLLYLMYASLVLPNISLFVSGFVAASLSIAFRVPLLLELVVSLIFPVIIVFFVTRGLKLTVKYTVIAGFLELIMVVVASLMFFIHRAVGLSLYNGFNFNINAVFLGVVFGILVFSGSGSSIFLSDNVTDAKRTIPRSILASYTISGILMIISSMALVLFLGKTGVSAYTVNPYVLLSMVYNKFGLLFYTVFIFFSVLSSANLTVSYTNALRNSFQRMLLEKVFWSKPVKINTPNYLMVAVALLSVLTGVIAFIYNDYFYIFAILAGVVSLSYMTIHIITNIALMKFRPGNSLFSVLVPPAISTILLSATFYYSAFATGSGLFISNLIFASLIFVSIVLALFIRLKGSHFAMINIDAEETGNNSKIQ